MDLYLKSKSARIIFITVSFVIAVFLIISILESWLSRIYARESTEEGLKEAIELAPDNPDNYILLANYLYLDFSPDKERILNLHKRSLELSPFNYNNWISLSEFLADNGDHGNALYALGVATNLAPGVASLRWKAAVMAIELNDKETVVSNLRKVISTDQQRRKLAFAALWQYIQDGDEILGSIPNNALPSYLEFLISTNRLAESKTAWNKLKDRKDIPDRLFFRYAGYLIDKGEIISAKEIWGGKYGEWEGVWNGNFEEEPTDGGFDWNIGRVEGAEIERDADSLDGKYSLKITFDGTKNINFSQLGQIIPVEGDTEYTLTSFMKSDKITTKDGVQWEVSCFPSDDLDILSQPPLVGTSGWHSVDFSFRTPFNCKAIDLRLRRFESHRLDRFISGTVWIDKVELKKSYLN
jgi:hypothetical protein